MWHGIGVQAYGAYFKEVRKNDDPDGGIELFQEVMEDALDEADIDWDDGWHIDLSADQITELLTGVLANSKELAGTEADLNGPLHTHIISKLYEADEENGHGEECFQKWEDALAALQPYELKQKKQDVFDEEKHRLHLISRLRGTARTEGNSLLALS